MHSKLKPGDLLYRSKGIVQHAGIYLGNGLILHNQPGKGVNITNYDDFANGQTVNVTSTETDTKHLANRITEIVGNDRRYKLLSNNCEHLAHYLLHGKKSSSQLSCATLGAGIFGLIGYSTNRGNLLLWLATGALAGVFFANLTQEYDYKIDTAVT